MNELAGKRAIVTGAANGIGRAIASALAHAGAAVRGIDVVPAPGIDVADVSDERAVNEAVATALVALGGLDILVNAAGIEHPAGLADSEAMVHFERMIAVNLKGPVLVTRACLPHFADDARIINIVSELAFLGRAGSSLYAATKGALLTLTRSWARELGPAICVNAIAPGPIDTALLGFARLSPELQALETSNPLRRIGRPDEVAAVAVFLASAGFVTGQCYSVDGGAAMH